MTKKSFWKDRKTLIIVISFLVIITVGILVWINRGNLFSSAAINPSPGEINVIFRPGGNVLASWTPSKTGVPHYQLVDEVTPDDSDYITTKSNTAYESFNFQTIAAPTTGTIKKIAVYGRGKCEMENPCDTYVNINTGGWQTQQTFFSPGSNFLDFNNVFYGNWQASMIPNLQVRLNKRLGTQVYVSQLYVVVTYSNTTVSPSPGTSTFLPDGTITRSDIAYSIGKSLSLSYDKASPTFLDVPRSNPSYKQIEALYQKGMINGCKTGITGKYFCPNDLATRATLAVFINRANYPCSMFSASPRPSPCPLTSPYPSPYYTDVPNTYWAFSDIQSLYMIGYMKGYGDNTFRPDENATRATLAVTLSRATGRSFDKPVPTFSDVPKTYWAYKEIEAIFQSGWMASKNIVSPSPSKS